MRCPSHRVLITGIGVISSIGNDVESFWAACLAGESRVEPIPGAWREHFEAVSQVWSPLALPDPRQRGLGRVELMQNDPVALVAAEAAAEALARAGLSAETANPRQNTLAVTGLAPGEGGVYLGTGIGGASTLLGMHAHQMLARPLGRAAGGEGDELRRALPFAPRFNPFSVAMSMPNAAAAFLGIKYGIDGENDTACAACASGTVAIGRAHRAVREGRVALALAGGAEYLDDPYGGLFRGFDAARTLARGDLGPGALNRPFDEARCGFLFSQGGAAMLVLESEERARGRGAPVVAEVRGFAESFDAHSMMSPEPSGAHVRQMIALALEDAGITASDVDYVNAHGTGTELNDLIEAQVIDDMLGREVLVNSTKSLLGHTIGASGALEAVVTALSIARGETHPCRNLERPIAPLNFARGRERRPIVHGLTQSFAFGGHNAALVLGRYPG